MEGLVKGDVVIVPFPFSDLSRAKRRPAFVLAVLPGDDVILCQITSKAVRDSFSIAMNDTDFSTGGLKKPSNLRPNRLFTADRSLILYVVGRLGESGVRAAVEAVLRIVSM